MLLFGPGPRLAFWTYLSIGAYQLREGEHAQEFILVGEQEDPMHAAIVTIAAYYHSGPSDQRLSVGHADSTRPPSSIGIRPAHRSSKAVEAVTAQEYHGK